MENDGAPFGQKARDGCGLDALVALAAFNGAVIALVASCCAALAADGALSLTAAGGGMVCLALWQRYLAD